VPSAGRAAEDQRPTEVGDHVIYLDSSPCRSGPPLSQRDALLSELFDPVGVRLLVHVVKARTDPRIGLGGSQVNTRCRRREFANEALSEAGVQVLCGVCGSTIQLGTYQRAEQGEQILPDLAGQIAGLVGAELKDIRVDRGSNDEPRTATD
jgi:hypothetical protein